MDKKGDVYNIYFSTKDFKNFNIIFAKILQNLSNDEKLPNFNLNFTQEEIFIQIPADPKSFYFISKIVEEIDDFSIKNVSNKKNFIDLQRVNSNDKEEGNEMIERANTSKSKKTSKIGIIEQEKSDIRADKHKENYTENVGIDTDSQGRKITNSDQNNIGKMIRRSSKSKEIREFILKLDKFSVKQIKNQFQDVHVAIVNNAIRIAEMKGLITCIAKDEYVVNNKI